MVELKILPVDGGDQVSGSAKTLAQGSPTTNERGYGSKPGETGKCVKSPGEPSDRSLGKKINEEFNSRKLYKLIEEVSLFVINHMLKMVKIWLLLLFLNHQKNPSYTFLQQNNKQILFYNN